MFFPIPKFSLPFQHNSYFPLVSFFSYCLIWTWRNCNFFDLSEISNFLLWHSFKAIITVTSSVTEERDFKVTFMHRSNIQKYYLKCLWSVSKYGYSGIRISFFQKPGGLTCPKSMWPGFILNETKPENVLQKCIISTLQLLIDTQPVP